MNCLGVIVPSKGWDILDFLGILGLGLSSISLVYELLCGLKSMGKLNNLKIFKNLPEGSSKSFVVAAISLFFACVGLIAGWPTIAVLILFVISTGISWYSFFKTDMSANVYNNDFKFFTMAITTISTVISTIGLILYILKLILLNSEGKLNWFAAS